MTKQAEKYPCKNRARLGFCCSSTTPDTSRERYIPIKNQSPREFPLGLSGAATRIRTGDLILTKDVLYQLSHSSIYHKNISS